MRDYGGRFDFNLTSEGKAYYRAITARAEFGRDGHPKGVISEEMQWALDVVRDRPEWSLPVLSELGFKEGQNGES